MPDYTARLQLPRPLLTELADGPLAFDNLTAVLDPPDPSGTTTQGVAVDGQGTLAQRPVSSPTHPGIRGRYWWSTDVGILSRDTGTGWVDINPAAIPYLIPTPVKSAAYTASPQDFVPIDTTGGLVVITLPNAPPDKTRIAAKIVHGANPATISAQGSDVFDIAGGATSYPLTILGQSVLLQYLASAGIWYALLGLGVPHVKRQSHTFTVDDQTSPNASSTVVGSFPVAVTPNETVTLIGAKIKCRVRGSTPSVFKLRYDHGVPGTLADIPGLTSLSPNTGAFVTVNATGGPLPLSDGDEIALVIVTAGNSEGFSISAVTEHTS